MTNETDEELYLRLKRWGQMTNTEIQKEVLLPKYCGFVTNMEGVLERRTEEKVLELWPRVVRLAEFACRTCKGKHMTPCRYTQYLESCVECGERIGDTPQGI